MKLLGWMHSKFRQNSCEPFKDFGIGKTSPDEQQYYPKPSYRSRHLRQPQKECFPQKSFAGLQAFRDDMNFEEPSIVISEFFHGFLAIGTLGSESVVPEPETPTFATPINSTTIKQMHITGNEFTPFSDVLEKVPGVDTIEDECNNSSGRNSRVSDITLHDELNKGRGSNVNGTMVCLLELHKVTALTKVHRTSLGELFQRSKIDENSSVKCEKEKSAEKSGVHLMQKMLKRMLNVSSSKSYNSATTAHSVPDDTKLRKILQIFHRKVHPESTKVTRKSNKSHIYAINDDQMQPDKDIDITTLPQKAGTNEGIRCDKSHSNLSPSTLDVSDSNQNGECWIKTDAEYLVLEL